MEQVPVEKLFTEAGFKPVGAIDTPLGIADMFLRDHDNRVFLVECMEKPRDEFGIVSNSIRLREFAKRLSETLSTLNSRGDNFKVWPVMIIQNSADLSTSARNSLNRTVSILTYDEIEQLSPEALRTRFFEEFQSETRGSNKKPDVLRFRPLLGS